MDGPLLESFRRGDSAALETVYRKHVDAVERFLAARLSLSRRFSAGALVNLVQDVFLRAFSPTARAGYDGEREYGPLLTISKNVLIDWFRRSNRESADGHALEALVNLPADNPTEDELFEPELVAATRSYVERLPQELRVVYEERFIRAGPQRGAAEALGLSRQNLRTLEKKLIEGLRRELRRVRLADAEVVFRQPNRSSGS